MSEVPICTIVIPSQLPSDEIELLETSLELTSVSVQKLSNRVIVADDIMLVATVMGGIAAAANLAEYSIKIAKVINNWREELRSKQIEPKGKLEHPARATIDLNIATDEEVEEWFSQR